MRAQYAPDLSELGAGVGSGDTIEMLNAEERDFLVR